MSNLYLTGDRDRDACVIRRFREYTGYRGAKVLPALEEAWNGEWDDEEDFATDLAYNFGYADPSSPSGLYFDYAAFARDVFMCDYFSAPAPGGGIFVFRNI